MAAVPNTAAAPLFTPYELPGGLKLQHRIVYAPLTRCRAFNNIPQPNAAVYYSQRATPGGLMISEGTIISERGFGYPCTPGIFTEEQVAGWKPVVKAVKDKGAAFFCQIWHVGRASHPHYQPNEELPISSSTLPITDGNQCFSLKTMQLEDYPAPRQLDASELPAIVDQYRQAARNAIEAGFDGVEIHGANGYLIDQFLKDGINQRTDAYGGSVENRCRFALEVVDAVVKEIGAEKTGIRLSPFGGFLSAQDSDPVGSVSYLLEQLNKYNLAWVHLVEPRVAGNVDLPADQIKESLAPFRKVYKGPLIVAGGHTAATGGEAVGSGAADLVCYGRHFIANPDLPRRFRLGAPLNKYDRNTFYTQGEEGYLDYPYLEESEEGKAFLATVKAD
ncbi:12-oxophytodienoic acid reductase [Chlorella sorokiniana]|uniref:12-oxophytodienoic acid reductase n=1 Tax=Chlorella sorokiniana TaxID=3076 RepID=A0A2P6TKG2_CHLSO|nr:12-oxophytodienoic acid reductase [Chlorella sorokiniana]|eukprot:PRW44569.1 12-oxophytodienoic acid reductase [Chlorella sorokiniana]